MGCINMNLNMNVNRSMAEEAIFEERTASDERTDKNETVCIALSLSVLLGCFLASFDFHVFIIIVHENAQE